MIGVTPRLKRGFLAASAALGVILCFGCMTEDEDGEICVALFCDGRKPESAKLEFSLSPDLVSLEVRAGKTFERGFTVWDAASDGGDRALAAVGKEGLILPLGDYTARARYVHGGDTVIAYDGGTLSYSERESCGETCYQAESATLDLALQSGVWGKGR